MKYLRRLSKWVTTNLGDVFGDYGENVYKRPYLPILFSVVLLSALGYGNLMYKETDSPDELWTPKDTRVKEDRSIMIEVYNRSARAQTFYIESRSEDLLTPSVFQELVYFHTQLSTQISVNNRFYKDLCLKSSSVTDGLCVTESFPLMFFLNSDGSFDLTHLASKQALLSKINSGKGTPDFYPPESMLYIPINNMFGGTTPSQATSKVDGTNDIEKALAATWTIYLNDENAFEELEEFQKKLEDLIENFNRSSEHIKIHPYSISLINRENEKAVEEGRQLIYLMISLEFIYSFYVLGQLNTRNSRLFVGVFGIASIGVAYVETFGLGGYLGLEGSDLMGIIPFLLIGIGLDDMYVLVLAFNCTSERLEGADRMKQMMKNAGVSITITSLTNLCTFAIGGLTTIPAIKNFCIYASFGMFFDYINQITLFLGVFAYDIKRSEKEKGDCCGLLFCKPTSKLCCNGKFIYDEEGTPKPAISTTLIRTFGNFLMKTWTRIVFLVLFGLLIALNSYGVYKIEYRFSTESFIAEDFRVAESVKVRDKYFSSNTETLDFYTVYADFENEITQAEMMEFETSISTCEDCKSNWILTASASSWYTPFKSWASRENCIDVNSSFIASEKFYECLKQWEEGEGQVLSSNLAWNDTRDKLIGAAIQASVYPTDSAKQSLKMTEDIRDIANKGPESSFPLGSFIFLADRYAVFESETTKGLVFSLGVVLIILLVTLADLKGSLLALGMIGLSVLGQLGTMYFWGEYTNTMTVTYSIMAIGVSVDYSSHFIHSYNHARGENRAERVVKSFEEIGVAIFNGGMSTLLAVLCLVLSNAHEIVIFYKSWFLIIFYSLASSLILLPILLSIFGSVHRKVEVAIDDMDSPETDDNMDNQNEIEGKNINC